MFPSQKKKAFPQNLQSLQYKQQSRPISPWSTYTPEFGQSSSPFPRFAHTLSTSITSPGELFLFGGCVDKSKLLPSNDLYVISTRDLSITPFKTSGDVPNPRYGHGAVLTSTFLLIWGGKTNFDENAPDDSLYVLNLKSREWTRVVVNGPKPDNRYYHTMTLVDSKLFVFGGWSIKGRRFLNDIWTLNLNCLKLNPIWESYEPTSGRKPDPRNDHVSVTTGDRIIIFGGCSSEGYLDDTWSFDISTRKWTELRCTGSIPSPRVRHAAVLLGNVVYVFGGFSGGRFNGTLQGDLTALNLSTQRWTAFQDIGPSPSARHHHAMAYDGTRVFVLGGILSRGAGAHETRHIHVLDTKQLDYPGPDSDVINSSEKAAQHVQKSSASPPTQAVVAENEWDRRIGQLTEELSLKSALLAQAAEEKKRARLELRELQAKLDESLMSRDHAIEQAKANAAEEMKRVGLELRGLQAKLGESLMSRDRALEQAEANAAEEKKRAGLELRELQAKLDESLLSRDHALEQAQSALHKASSAAEANEQSQRELTEIRAELEASRSESTAFRLRLADSENGCAKSKAEADTYPNQNETGFVNTDEDRLVHRLMERMQAMEAEMASLRWNEKRFEMMECRNED